VLGVTAECFVDLLVPKLGYKRVYANSQRGNIVLSGVEAQAGHRQEALLLIPPIVPFVLGIALAEILALPPVRERRQPRPRPA
jgi:uncharacterized membrane protein YoaK (UPF0700 family)